MSKTVFEKWIEVEEKSVDDNYILEYYLSQKTKTRIYFSLIDSSKVIYLEFSKVALSSYDCPDLKGLDISVQDVSVISSEKRYIVIKNATNNNEIFLAFSSSLCDALIDVDSYFETFNVLKAVIKEYKEYFANPNKILSQQEEQGLCAELLQLKYLVEKFGENIVINWQGPRRNKRDFVFEKTALEVKSTMSQTNTNVLISNENQLDFYVNYINIQNNIPKEKVVNILDLSKEDSLNSIKYSSLLPFNPRGTMGLNEQFIKDLSEGLYNGYNLDGGLVNNTLLSPLLNKDLDKIIIISNSHDYTLPDEFKNIYNEDNIIIVRPKTEFTKGDTLKFEKEFCNKIYHEGYEIGKSLNISV